MATADPANPSTPVALVTGASYGVGAATAVALAREGFDLAISATRLANLDATAKTLQALGCRITKVELDLCSQSSINAAMASVLDAHGRLDVLVNNAAVNLRKAAVDVTPDDWDAVMRANTTGTFFITQAFARHRISAGQPGCVVNVSSTHGLVGAAERSTYGISKGAVLQMTRMLAIEWAADGIRVNAVAPGRLDTASPSRVAKSGDAKYMQAMIDRIPLHRLATAEDVAEAVAYLAGPRGGFITGHTMVVDGGLTAY